jgi:hypothetical protein
MLRKFMKERNNVRRGAREATLQYFASRPLMVFQTRASSATGAPTSVSASAAVFCLRQQMVTLLSPWTMLRNFWPR